MQRRFSAVLFDVDDTLVDRASALDSALALFVRRHSDAFAASRPKAVAAELRRLDAGGRTSRVAFGRSVLAVFPAIQLTPDEVWRQISDDLTRAVRPKRTVTDWLSRLAAGNPWKLRAREAGCQVPLGVVSNGGGGRQRSKLARAGLARFFPREAVVISGEVGVAKPDPEIFAIALRRLGCDASAALMVGDDSRRDVAGARAAGLRSCWISHGRPLPAAAEPADIVVERIEQLALSPPLRPPRSLPEPAPW